MAATDFLGTINTGAFNNDYTFLETVGKGGYGEVYKVQSKKDDQTYAVKKIRFDQFKRKRKLLLIKRELIHNAKLSHENVVRYYDSWVEESPDQTLNRLTSTDSETETSKSHNLTSERSNNGQELNTSDENDRQTLNKQKTRSLKVSDSCVNSEDQRETSDTSNNSVDNNTDDEQETKSEKIFDNIESETFKDSSEDKKNTANALPDFDMLQISFDERSIESESGEKDSSSTEEASDILFDKDAPADIQWFKGEDIGDDETGDFQGASEEDVQEIANLTDMILKQLSGSISHNKDLDFIQDSELGEAEMPCSATITGPRYLDLYIKMEFCEQTLREVIDNRVLVDDNVKCWDFFRQIVRGLDYIHSRGISHRDLNPNNIFVKFEDTIKIGDFGLSRIHGDDDVLSVNIIVPELRNISQEGLTGNIGTVWYTAPEVLGKSSCSYGHEVDLFSLGLIFFEMCHEPLKTQQEKAIIFEPLRKSKLFPKSFDVQLKEKQTIIITKLLDLDPAERLPLRKLLDPAEGYLELEPLEERNFKLMVAKVLSQPKSDLYQYLISELFTKRSGKCLPTFKFYDTPKRVTKIKYAFAAVAESHGASERNLPLFVPLSDIGIPIVNETLVLDQHGNPSMISDSSLRALSYDLLQRMVPPKTDIYSTQGLFGPHIHPYIMYVSFSANNDMLAIGKSLLILQECIVKSGYKTEEFVLCLTHRNLEDCLIKIYELGEKEISLLHLIGDSIHRLLLFKLVEKLLDISLPEVFAITGNVKKMSNKIRNILGRLHQSVQGFNEDSAKHAGDALDIINNVKVILDNIGVRFDVNIELCVGNTHVGPKEIGLKFLLRSKPKLKIIVRGGQYETNMSDAKPIEFLWYEMDAFSLKTTDIVFDMIDVCIIYNSSKSEEVKCTAVLYGKLTNSGIHVSTINRNEKVEGQMNISPYCKFLVLVEGQSAVVKYEQDKKLKVVPMKIKTVVRHVKQRKDVPCRQWFLSGGSL